MLADRRARLSALALVALGLGACSSSPVPVAGPAAGKAPQAPAAAAATSGPHAAPGAIALPRPAVAAPGSAAPGSVVPGGVVPGGVVPGSVVPGSVAPGNAVPGASASPLPVAPSAAPIRRPRLISDPVSPGGVPFLPAAEPALSAASKPAPDVPTPPVPELAGTPTPTPQPEPALAAPGLSVPFGLYAAGGYNGTSTVYTAAMQMRDDGTYSMQTASGADIPDPATGQAGTYRVLNGSALEFLTGPYAGHKATVIPDYQSTGRHFIDVTVDGVFTSYHFERP